MEKARSDLVSRAVREGADAAGLSIRQLAQGSGVSPAQINRLRGGQANPTRDTLVDVARALGRNPNLLFIVSGHLHGDESREVLRRVFADDSEHIEVWKWEGKKVEHARRVIEDPDTADFDLAVLALDVFLGPESEENLWQDPFLGSVVQGKDAPLIRALLRDWAYLTAMRKQRVMDYVRDQADLARRESGDEIREKHPGYGNP